MTLLLAVTEATTEEGSGHAIPIILGLTVFGILGLLLFLISRLDLDR